MTINVLEIRNYLFAPDSLEHFIDYFEAHFIQSQEALDMHILGQFRLEDEPDHFVWMRGFSDMGVRLAGLRSYYSSDLWKKYRPFTADIMLTFDNVHLLRPIDEAGHDLTGGVDANTIAAELADGTILPEPGVIVVDFYEALPGLRESLIAAFKSEAAPVYAGEGIQMRGMYVAEMHPNEYPGLPVMQKPDEFVVITAYNSPVSCREKRLPVSQRIQSHIAPMLSKVPEALVLRPTLRSPLRYLHR